MKLIVSFILSWILMLGYAMAENEQTIYGYVEKVTLIGQDLELSAKLDTGAKSASLNALSIKEIEKDGKKYLSFIVPSKEGDKKFIAEYIGEVNIKARVGEIKAAHLLRKSLSRPVVKLKMKMGDKVREIRVNLTNRKRFIYPILLGRDAIKKFDGIVDPSAKFTIVKNNENEP